MKTRTLLQTFCLFLAIGFIPADNSSAVELTFNEVMEQARNRPAVLAGWDHAEAARHAATADFRANFLPGIGGQAQILERNRDLYTVTPFGDFPYGKDRIRSAGIQVVQPIFNPARLFGTTPALRREAAARAYLAHRIQQESAAAAGEAYIDVLVIDARLRTVGAYVQNLAGRLQEIEAMQVAGRVLASDALKVQLALDSARQEELTLTELRSVATFALGVGAGLDEEVEPAGGVNLPAIEPINVNSLITTALELRPDLKALEEQQRALGSRKKGVFAEALPQVEARLGWIWSDADITTPRDWGEGALVLTWNPIASGSRFPRAEVYEVEARAAKHRLLEAHRAIGLEIRSAVAGLETAHAALEVGNRGVVQATEALRVERERYDAARATANDLLDAEASLKDKRAERDVSELEIQRARLRLNAALGVIDG